MNFKKIYNFVKIFTTVFIAALFLLIDCVIFYFQDFVLYLFFIPLEAVILAVWIIILKFNKTTVMRIETNKGTISIFTYGKDYTVKAENITVKPGNFSYYLYFDDVKLRANSSSKSVGTFLHKYQNIYKKIEQ